LVARVNGEPIRLATFQAEVTRLMQTSDLSESEAQRRVLDDLIAQVLLAQAARAAGYTPDVDGRLATLVEAAGGEEAFRAWLEANNYILDEFREALAQAMAAAWMRDQIIATVPEVAEQIHARHIFVYNEEQVQTVLAKLQAGADFGDLAAQFDPVGQGDLGWFPRGYLFNGQVEEAAFALQPGEISAPIPADGGFYLIQVLERDGQRPLTPDMRRQLQEQYLQNWIADRRAQARIEVFITPES